jgi:hypothetical protein
VLNGPKPAQVYYRCVNNQTARELGFAIECSIDAARLGDGGARKQSIESLESLSRVLGNGSVEDELDHALLAELEGPDKDVLKKYRSLADKVIGGTWQAEAHQLRMLADSLLFQSDMELSRTVWRLASDKVEFPENFFARVLADNLKPLASVNPGSLKAFISQEPIVAQLDAQIAAIRVSTLNQHPPPDTALELMSGLTNTAGLATIVQLRNSLREHEADVLACVKVWDQLPFGATNQGTVLSRGACISDLAIMLVGVRGGESERKALDLMKADGYSLKDIKIQMRVAYLRAKHTE